MKNLIKSASWSTVDWYGSLQSSKEIADGNWHHVSVTLVNGTLTMYIDGVADVIAIRKFI